MSYLELFYIINCIYPYFALFSDITSFVISIFDQNISQRYKKHFQRCFNKIVNNNFVELF